MARWPLLASRASLLWLSLASTLLWLLISFDVVSWL